MQAWGLPSHEPLPLEAYLGNERNFAGNRYQLNARVDSQLAFDASRGRILAVEPQETQARVVVFVPATIEASISANQRLKLVVSVREGGLLEVESLKKY